MIKIFSILLIFLLISCSSNTIKVIDPNGNPIKDALVLSEQHAGYAFTPWIVSINNTDIKGEAYNASSTFSSIFKIGFHPIVQRNDLTGVLYPRSKRDKDGSIHSILTDLYYPNYFGRKPIEGVVTLYPIVSPELSKYTVVAKDYVILSDANIHLETNECTDIAVEYRPTDNSFYITSRSKNILPSERFFFVGSSSKIAISHFKSNKLASFYCENPDSSIYKIAWAVNHVKSSYRVQSHTLIKITSKVNNKNQKIEPLIKPIHSIFLDTPFIYKNIPKLISNLEEESFIKSINKNIPDELNFKSKWLDVYRNIKANK